MNKILFCGLEPWEKEYINAKTKLAELGLDVSYQDKDLDADNLPADLSAVSYTHLTLPTKRIV